MDVACRITRTDGAIEDVALLCRIDTIDEVQYFQSGGILQHVLDNLTAA
jgi:aconitate hydratase